jgi:SAM-dependent methyltransferase
MTSYAESVNNHYSRPNLKDVILDALRAAGKDLTQLKYSDLATLDHFHAGGRSATLQLANLAGFPAGAHVLDAGGGIGGVARTLAAEFGWKVTVLDLTAEYCRVGEMLTEMTGLDSQVRFKEGSALDIPFPDASFDAVWTQHSTMNIDDKETLYAELHRVLRPGGRLAMHENMAGRVEPLHFPVPWAATPDISFLRPVDAMRSLIASAGFREITWVDVTAATLALPAPPPGSRSTPGLGVIMGEGFGTAVRNMMRNFAEDRAAVVMAVFERI